MRTEFRIRISQTTSLADSLALICAKSNGNEHFELSLEDIVGYVNCEMIRFPYINKNLVVTIVGENKLMIDQNSESLAEIELIEIVDLDYTFPQSEN
jgi:hypothetical protein